MVTMADSGGDIAVRSRELSAPKVEGDSGIGKKRLLQGEESEDFESGRQWGELSKRKP